MEKMQTIIALLIFISAPVITMAVFAQIVLRATISDNEEFKKYFMQTIALVLLWIDILLVLCILNYPLIIKFLNSQEVLRKMEKTLFVIYALSTVLFFIINSTIFKQVKSKGFFSTGEEEFMKDLLEKVTLWMTPIALLSLSCLLDFPIVDRAWLLLQ